MRTQILFFVLALGCSSEAASPRQATTNGVGNGVAGSMNTSSSAGSAGTPGSGGTGGAIVAMDGTVAGSGGELASAGAGSTGSGGGFTCPLGHNPEAAPVPCNPEEEGTGCGYAIACGPLCNSPCAPRELPDAPEPPLLTNWFCSDGFWVAQSSPCQGAQYYTCECEGDAAPPQDAGSSDAG